MARNYEVGYKKPPVRSRFKPGQSGNPRGKKKPPRPKLNVFEDLERFLQTEITVNEGGTTKRLKRIDALFHSLFAGAAKGDPRAYSLLFTTLQKAGRLSPPTQEHCGVLVVPAPDSEAKWERRVGIEQRPHRGASAD